VGIPDGTLIMYSAATDKLLPETGVENSLFTRELIKEIGVPNASAEDAFNRARLAVSSASKQQQIPWVSSSLINPFSFTSSGPVVSHAPAVPAPPPPGAPVSSAVSASGEAPLSAERERTISPKDTFRECAACPEMVVIPAGEFVMGSPESEPQRYPNEGPQHNVKIGRPFAVSKFKVTRDEFETFVRATNYAASNKCFTIEQGKVEERNERSFRNPGFAQDGNHPAVCVNWIDAKAYVEWLTRKTGRVYRLLTESEWEYAARAGTATPFWWGAAISTDQANYDGNSTYAGGGKGEDRQKTVPVESFGPNPWGLYQVHGNAFEWVEDCWNDNYQNAPADDSVNLSGNCSRHVRRGGAWNYIAPTLRAAYRDARAAALRGSNIGFRVARTLNPGPP
jgi:formylglycine-generating enzyme required for sulfatase activity